MSLESIQTVIGRALVETEYRNLLVNDPAKALEGYDLTEEETQSLMNINKEQLDKMAVEMEERISKAGLFAAGDINLGDNRLHGIKYDGRLLFPK
jgi:hypothetical protein